MRSQAHHTRNTYNTFSRYQPSHTSNTPVSALSGVPKHPTERQDKVLYKDRQAEDKAPNQAHQRYRKQENTIPEALRPLEAKARMADFLDQNQSHLPPERKRELQVLFVKLIRHLQPKRNDKYNKMYV